MSTRLMPPGDQMRQAEVSRPDGHGRRYTVGRDGAVAPRTRHDERVLRENGWTAKPVAATYATAGRTCTTCGFVAVFVRCGRCGGECI